MPTALDLAVNLTGSGITEGQGKAWFTAMRASLAEMGDPMGRAGALQNLSLAFSVGANALTANVKTRAGAAPSATDPVSAALRNATLASGDFNVRNITGALSLVISSGSTLGHASATASRIYWYLIDNAGTLELAASTTFFGHNGIVSTTAEGGAGGADSATVMYSTTARSNVAFTFIARTTDTQTTAGTWTAVPTSVELAPISDLVDASVTAAKLASSALGMSMVNGTFARSVAANALTISIKTLAGTDPSPTDPVYVLFRNVTADVGDFTAIAITAATSFTVSSGSTLGTSNNVAFRGWIVGFNDAGTFRLGVINCLSGVNVYPLGGWGIASSTAEGGAGAADSAQVFYTGTAVTSKPYVVLGYFTYESGLATAGTWSATPTRMQLHYRGDPLPGTRIQMQRTDSGAVATGTTTVPDDDTIPQSTEGDQYLSQAITPTSGANILDVTAQLLFAHSSGGGAAAIALFRDSGTDAISATRATMHALNSIDGPFLNSKIVLAGSTSATTFKVRAGSEQAGTTTVNGVSAARKYGGVLNSFLQIEEIMT